MAKGCSHCSKSYSLFVNNGENHLHGGREGFDKKLWDHAVCDDSVVFYLQSPDGEEGYPGTLQVSVTFTLSENGSLTLEYKAVSDADTVINLTNHSYFNLNGHNSGTVLGQQLQIYSDSFTENDNQCLPTGRILPVEGTPLDFRQAKAIGQEIDSPDINLLNCGGYDHNYVLANPNGLLQSCARAHSEATGIFLLCKTTQPGLQFYSANFLHTCNVKGKGGAVYPKHGGFCLEAQHYPNAMANPDFPSVVLQGGETYRQCIEFVFSAGE